MKDKLLISPAIRRFLQIWSWIGIIIVLILSILDIIGWIFNFPRLTGFSIYFTQMRPVTAISFLLCSAAFIFLAIDLNGKIRNLMISISGLIVGLIGLLTIMSYLGFFFTGEEMAITTAPLLELFLSPGLRMALLTAFCFLIIGIVFLWLSSHKPLAANVAHGLIIFPLSLSYLVVMSYLLHVYHIHEIQDVAVALNTGIALFLLCIALLFLNPESWLMKNFAGNYAGSLMARRLLPGLIVLPVLIGWLRIQGEQHGLFKSEVGVTLVALTYTLCFLGLVWLTAYSVNRSDKERVRNESFLSEAQRIAKIGSWEWNVQTGKFFWSDEMYRIFGEVKGNFIPTYEDFLNHVHPDDRQKMKNAIKETIEKDRPFNLEYRILTKAGIECYVAAHADILKDEKNEVQLFIGTVLDISDRKKIEEALQASRESLSTTLASIGDAVIATDIRGNITFLNRVAEDLTCWDYEDALGKPANEVFHIINEQSRLEVENPVTKVLKTGKVEGLANHTVLVRKDGTEIPIDDSGAPIHQTGGQIAGVVLVFRDITERKKAENVLQNTLERFYLMLANMYSGVVLMTDKGKVEFVNQAFCDAYMIKDLPEKLVGVSSEDLLTMILPAFPDPEAAKVRLLEILQKMQPVKSEEFSLKDGKSGMRDFVPLNIQGILRGRMWIHTDITGLKQAQEAVKKSEAKLKEIYESMTEGLALHDLVYDNKGKAVDYIITEVNPAYEIITGLERNKALGRKASEIYSTTDAPYLDLYAEVVTTGKPASFETFFPPMNKHFLISAFSPAKGKLGTVFQDITKRKLAEEALQESQEHFQSVLDSSIDVIYRFNLQTEKYEYFSPSCLRVFGYTAKEFTQMDQQTATAMIHPGDLDRVKALLANLNDSGTGKLDYRFKFKDGDYRWISNHLSVIRDNEGRPLYRDGNVRDITELKRYEEEIIAANEELTAFNTAMVGRELRMIELKKEINQLCAEMNKPPVYEIENEEVLS
jgi:PAS domain S-box-containing protein